MRIRALGSMPPCRLASHALLGPSSPGWPAQARGLPPGPCIQPLRHQHQEASHPIQGLCTVDFRLRNDGLGLGSAVGREQRAQLCLEWPPGDIYSGEKNLHPECKIKHTSDKRKRKRGERKPEKQTCLLRAALIKNTTG